jgi:hypothetical protein
MRLFSSLGRIGNGKQNLQPVITSDIKLLKYFEPRNIHSESQQNVGHENGEPVSHPVEIVYTKTKSRSRLMDGC